MAQVSMEAALDACREKLGELMYETVLLRAQVAEADRLTAALKEQLAAQAVQPAMGGESPQQDQTMLSATS